ncbi:MAG: redox-regulated ATPase YchF [Candidatus Aenigmatarchaeota archaeon]
MQIGLVGAPSSGKSTFFKAATMVDVAIASYPFTTIEPNTGIGFVRVPCADKELNVTCNPRYGFCHNHIRYVPINILDVAGLVPGAHEGKGLGNKFLNDLNQADVLIHIVDVSGTTNEEGKPTEGHDPSITVNFLENEIDLWYSDILKKGLVKVAKQVQSQKGDIGKTLTDQMSSFKVTESMMDRSISKLSINKADPVSWTDEQTFKLAKELRKLTKPIVIACNKMDLPNSSKNYENLKKNFPDHTMIPCSADFELLLKMAAKNGVIEYYPGESDFKLLTPEKLNQKQLDALEKIREFMKTHQSTGVQDVLEKAVFEFLKYIAIFPGGMHKLGDKEGRILPDCFLMPPGTTAFNFANKIHTDLGKGFLFAMDVRKRLKIGKDHELKHRDVIEIISAAK